jgi:hypothetical protein
MKRLARYLLFAAVCLTLAATVQAQQLITSIPATDALPSPAAQAQGEEEDFIVPSRPSLSNPAEFQRAGVLQLEYGYDAAFRAAGFRVQQVAPLALRFAASRRVLLEADLDTVSSQTDETHTRMTGIGDTQLGVQVVAVKETEEHPALAFAYYVKLPSASQNKNLGSGRFDHKILMLVSKKVGGTTVDFNAVYLINGREHESGWVTGGEYALAFSHGFKKKLGVQGEISGQTKDDAQPVGLFTLGALTYNVNRRLVLDGGMRFGLTSDAPRVGVFAGLTVGIANLYKK